MIRLTRPATTVDSPAKKRGQTKKPSKVTAMLRKSASILTHLVVLAGGIALLVATFQVASSSEDAGPEAVQSKELAEVTLTPIHRQPIQLSTTYVGAFEPFERYRMGFEGAGTIQGLNGNDSDQQLIEGDLVYSGQTVARLDTDLLSLSLESAQLELERADADLKRLERIQSANKKAVATRQITERRIARKVAEVNAKRLSTQIERAELQAPAACVVANRLRRAGETINAYEPVLELLEVSRLLLTVGVPESRIHEIRLGQPVQLRVLRRSSLGTPESILLGTVYRIAEAADRQIGAFPVAIEVPNWITVTGDTEGKDVPVVGGSLANNVVRLQVEDVASLQLDLMLAGVDTSKKLTIEIEEQKNGKDETGQAHLR